MSDLRRYEIFLPQKFNDGQPVPEELIADTLFELREQFGAVSWGTRAIRGMWQHEGIVFRDDLIRVFVDVPDLPANRQFFRQLKERLRVRFRQIEIRVTTYPVDLV